MKSLISAVQEVSQRFYFWREQKAYAIPPPETTKEILARDITSAVLVVKAQFGFDFWAMGLGSVKFNDTIVGDMNWWHQATEAVKEFPIDPRWVRFGTNEVWIDAQGPPGSSMTLTVYLEVSAREVVPPPDGDGDEVVEGGLTVRTTPVVGKIFVDGAYEGAGQIALSLTPAYYTVGFGDVEGHNTPTDQRVGVMADRTTDVVGTYTVIPDGDDDRDGDEEGIPWLYIAVGGGIAILLVVLLVGVWRRG